MNMGLAVAGLLGSRARFCARSNLKTPGLVGECNEAGDSGFDLSNRGDNKCLLFEFSSRHKSFALAIELGFDSICGELECLVKSL